MISRLLTSFAVLSVALTGCGGGSSRLNKPLCEGGSCSKSNAAPAFQAGNSQAQLGDPVAQLNAVHAELGNLTAVNLKLCEKLNQVSLTCPVTTPLIPAEKDNVLQCSAGAANAVVQSEFKVRAKAVSATDRPGVGVGNWIDLVLKANGDYFYTDKLDPNIAAPVLWKSRSYKVVEPPRLRDLYSLRLTDTGVLAGTLTKADITDFTLEVNGIVVFTLNDLVQIDNVVTVNLEKIRSLAGSKECQVTSKDFDKLQIDAKEELKKIGATPETVASPEAARAQLPVKQANLDRERGRSAALRRALGLDAARGCWADALITSMEVEINGGPAGAGDGRMVVQERLSAPLQSQGSSSSYTFQLADGLRISATNGTGGTLFRPEGKLIKTDFATTPTVVGELSFLRIIRNGTSYDQTSAQDCNSGFFGLFGGCNTTFISTETMSMFMNRVTVKVNGQIAYDRDALNHTFKRDSLVYTDGNFSSNQSWVALMGRQDCAVTATTVPAKP